jgi:hypothetical protein
MDRAEVGIKCNTRENRDNGRSVVEREVDCREDERSNGRI